MSRYSQIVAFIALPVFTLILGLQLGMRYEAGTISAVAQTVTASGSVTTGSGITITNPEKQVDISLLWTAWNLLLQKYVNVQDMNTQTMVYGAIKGMVASLGDPYTLFMTPTENTNFENTLSGQLEGIGAELTLKGTEVVVVSVIKSSPAEKAGLLPDDTIVSINGQVANGMSLDEVVGLIRGNKGTTVTLVIQRAKEPSTRSFTITRDEIQVPSTEYSVKTTAQGNVGYLAINEFGSDTVDGARAALSKIDTKTLKGLIIDLRYNGGGYLDGAVDLSSMFLTSGRVVSVVERNTTETHDVSGNTILPTIPLVILVNEDSASASEIFAGAMQDHKRATIIGTQSFGKGTVQEVIDLPGGSSLRVTIAKWQTPNGHDIGKKGITPDIVVPLQSQDYDTANDVQLQAAEQFLTTGHVNVKTATGSVVK